MYSKHRIYMGVFNDVAAASARQRSSALRLRKLECVRPIPAVVGAVLPIDGLEEGKLDAILCIATNQ